MTTHYDISWLKQATEKGEILKFLYFWGHTNKHNELAGKFCFSQWHESSFSENGVLYKTAEHWMMGQKALLFNDSDSFENIVKSVKPGEAKDIGRKINGFIDEV